MVPTTTQLALALLALCVSAGAIECARTRRPPWLLFPIIATVLAVLPTIAVVWTRTRAGAPLADGLRAGPGAAALGAGLGLGAALLCSPAKFVATPRAVCAVVFGPVLMTALVWPDRMPVLLGQVLVIAWLAWAWVASAPSDADAAVAAPRGSLVATGLGIAGLGLAVAAASAVPAGAAAWLLVPLLLVHATLTLAAARCAEDDVPWGPVAAAVLTVGAPILGGLGAAGVTRAIAGASTRAQAEGWVQAIATELAGRPVLVGLGDLWGPCVAAVVFCAAAVLTGWPGGSAFGRRIVGAATLALGFCVVVAALLEPGLGRPE